MKLKIPSVTFFLLEFSSLNNGPVTKITLNDNMPKYTSYITGIETNVVELKDCIAFCNLHYRQDCHYTVWFAQNTCYFGNFLATSFLTINVQATDLTHAVLQKC